MSLGEGAGGVQEGTVKVMYQFLRLISIYCKLIV